PASAQTSQAVSLSGTGSSDPDNQALTYAWSQDSGPAGTFSSASGSSTTFTAPSSAGTVVVSLTVTDTTGFTSKATQSIAVSKPASTDSGGCTSTGSPTSVMALVAVAAFGLLARRRRI